MLTAAQSSPCPYHPTTKSIHNTHMYITALPSEQCGQYLKNLSLLYVEDEEEIRTLLSKIIEHRVGKLLTASNGREGLEMFREQRPDLVITDIRMPEMDGLAMIEAICQIDPHVPILITTAFNETDYLLKAIELGVTKYLLKPIRIAKLEQALMEVGLWLHADTELQISQVVFETSHNGILVADSHMTVDAVNPAFCEMSGFSRAEIMGQSLEQFECKAFEEPKGNSVWELLRQRQSWSGIGECIRKTGEPYFTSIKAIAIRNRKQEVVRYLYIGMFNDITEQKLANERIQHLAYYDVLTQLPNRGRKMQDSLMLIQELRKALEQGEFVLHYQPQMDGKTGTLVGIEALIRWVHPVRGLVSPVHFIGFAEQVGLIERIGQWVLREACRQLSVWQLASGLRVSVAVNLSARQFNDKNLVDIVRNTLIESSLDSRYLELEVTEDSIMTDAEDVIATLHELKEMGVRIAIDDFGTGYSSLNYLKRFPIGKLKIDQSFVRDICHSAQDKAICGAIIGIAKNLQLSTVVEGVETSEQLEVLRTLGCETIQGHLYSRPLSPEDFFQSYVMTNNN